ncbi:GlsB/YeaQ/YmgE family stress response membrane protein [Paraburkholderia fungorum]|uniref:GlsB/YeaQ/YmgE family stress response membrane protein n=1 Tax=Paraburkholderia fungorum TaxID=134537 RepID=UPI0038BB0BE7
MDPVSHGIIFWLIIGGIAGALAGRIVDDGGFGILVDIIVGIVGAFIGGWLGGVLGLHLGSGIIGSLITALIGAVILLAHPAPVQRRSRAFTLTPVLD